MIYLNRQNTKLMYTSQTKHQSDIINYVNIPLKADGIKRHWTNRKASRGVQL